jgi:hypothetical protein
MKQGDYRKAYYRSLCLLNETPLQAAREIYHIHAQVEVENHVYAGRVPQFISSRIQLPHPKNRFPMTNVGFGGRLWQLWSVKRIRRALYAACVVMASQQLCGVNIIGAFPLANLSCSMSKV